MTKKEATNIFTDGMVMDINPLVTPNNVLTNCLNGTLVSMDGNMNVLQNDMGNGRVETAYLPEGYIPIGTCSFGGIIYIVSYNPLTNKSLIGSFPSPERNITTDELGDTKKLLNMSEFYSEKDSELIITPLKRLILLDKELHPGDKFQIYCTELNNKDYISAKGVINTTFNPNKFPRYLKLNVVSVQDNGKIINLNNSLVWNDNYYIYQKEINRNSEGELDLEEYRNLILSNYNVFDSKVDGKLAILALLECIDSFDVSWDAIKEEDNWNIYLFLNWEYNNDISKDKINVSNIRVDYKNEDEDWDNSTKTLIEITNYPSLNGPTLTDIIYNENNVFYTPYYVDNIENIDSVDYNTNGNIKSPRRNDGTDNQFLLTTPISLSENVEGVVNFRVYPGMPFGYLDYLKAEFSIDINKLGTGEITLKEYRYFYNLNNTITLNWAIDAYLERHKVIEEIRFNFYKFDSNVYQWVVNNSESIDNDRVVNSAWENSNNLVEELIDADESYLVSSQSSYSGNFSENINTLESNQLYLTEIVINYNNDKIIKYYRFLYTSDILNQYYYSSDIDNDFKNIELDSVINNNLSYGSSILNLNNVDNYYELFDPQGKEIEKIPSIIDSDKDPKQLYTVENNYKCDVSFNLQSSISKGFKVAIDNLLINDIKDTTETNAKLQSFDYRNTASTTDYLLEITKEINYDITNNNNTDFSGTFNLVLKTPIEVNYNSTGSVPIPYKLTNLTISEYWLLVDGRKTYIILYLNDYYQSAGESSEENLVKFGDNDKGRKYMELSSYSNVYNSIKETLKSGTDIVVLKFRVYHGARAGSGCYTMWGNGLWNNSENGGFSNQRVWDSAGDLNNDNGGVLLLYAMLDKKGDVQLFTFAPTISTTWYGLAAAPTSNLTRWSLTNKPFAIRKKDLTSEVAKAPFNKYYKITENNNTKEVKSWSRVYYFNNYTYSIMFNIECTFDIKISFNNLEIESNPSLPNNLRYKSERNYTIELSINVKENFDSYIDGIYNAHSNITLVDREGADPLEISDVSPKALYDFSGNLVKTLKKDEGLKNISLSELANTDYGISYESDGLKVSLVGNIPDTHNYSIMGRLEEQSLSIRNIILLN